MADLLEQILLECEICLFNFAIETLNIFLTLYIQNSESGSQRYLF